MSRLLPSLRTLRPALCLLGTAAGLHAVTPTIIGVSPASGPAAGGTVVTITGTNLTGATTASFGGTLGTITANSATEITVTSPARSAGAVDITVTTPGGTSATSAADQFTFIEAPTVISVIPSTGPTAGGTSVTLTGTSFTGASAVKFGATSAGFTVDSATQITVTSPLGAAGVVDITVTGPGGTSATGVGDQFTYAAAPAVTSISPVSGPAAGGTGVSITGTNLAGATAVSFGGTPGTITANSATLITATSPAGSGVVDITVTTAGGTSALSGADQFTYLPAPTVASLTPALGSTTGGTAVVLTGTHFTGVSAVAFGGNAATNFNVDSATQITAVSPASSVGTVNVRVTTGGGISAVGAGNQYTYDAGPAVVSVAVPANGSYKAGASLDFTISFDQNATITGTPQLAVTIGNSTVQAGYVSSPTATTALFRYTVLAGQNDPDGIALGVLTLNGGTIRNGNGTDATLTLNSVASTSQVLVDTTAPTINSIARNNPATVNTSGAAATWRVTFGEAVTGVDISDFQLTLVSGSASGAIASATPAGAGVYDVAVNAISGQGQLRLDLKASGTGIADAATNALSGGFTSGDSYQVGVTSVFDAVALTNGSAPNVSHATTVKLAQRFTTAAAQPLALTTVMASLGPVSGNPIPVVTINADNAGAPGTVVATLTNPGSLTSNTLATWTGSTLLTASTTYWIVFDDASASGSYQINASALTSGGAGAWLNSPADYAYRFGADAATTQTGALQIAIGATSTPSITSALAAGGSYGSTFSYQITASNMPISYAATGLPAGLTLNTTSGLISGTLGGTGTFNVALTAANGNGTGAPSTLVVTVGKAEITVTVDAKTKVYNTANPALTFSYSGFVLGDTASVLATTPMLTTDAATNSDAGSYAIRFASGATASNYTFQYVTGTLTVTKAPQTITFPDPAVTWGKTITFGATASSGLPITYTLVSAPATFNGGDFNASTGGFKASMMGSFTVRADQAGNTNYGAAEPVARTFAVQNPVVGPASIVNQFLTQFQSVVINLTSALTSNLPNDIIGTFIKSAVLTINGQVLSLGAKPGSIQDTGTQELNLSVTVASWQPSSVGLYSYLATLADGTQIAALPAILGITTTEKVIGAGEEVGANIVHPNGNTYDQLLLEGQAASLTADKGQVTRISFVDLTNDIVQVEFSGAGTLTVNLSNAGTPAPATNYNQPGVNYVRGHASIVINDADETTNLAIFTVGKATAVNQALFRSDVTYDGVADIAYVAIKSANGKFGSVRAGNVHFFATAGETGLYAPGVAFTGVVNIGNVQAYDSARPVLLLGSTTTDVNITGGSLQQANGQPVLVSGITKLKFVAGTDSAGATFPAQANKAVLLQDGTDVTTRIVVKP